MDKAALDELIQYKEVESVHFARHLFWMARDVHCEIVAYCNRRVEYPFDLQREAFSFVFLAGAAYLNLLNIVSKVKAEPTAIKKAWKAQILSNRAIKVLVDRRDALSHGRLNRWLLKTDGGEAQTEDEKYPHLPLVTVFDPPYLGYNGNKLPIHFQWNDKHCLEFTDCLAWQEEVLQELHHQERNHSAILQKLRSPNNPVDIVRRRLALPERNGV